MPSDPLWHHLVKPNILKRGWHLARLDTKQDFAEDLFPTDVFGYELDDQLQEIANRIKTDTYQPRPLLRMEVPKGRLGFRPGTVIPIQDRVVVSAIVLLLAPEIDKRYKNSVYSWRLKVPTPQSGPIFKEALATDLPFLKKNTIRQTIDPFTPWYTVWPEFDEKSRQTFGDDGYRYMATSDIAAYFENIQLPILRDQLLGHFPRNSRIINLLFSFLESWAQKTLEGRPHMRGIPQGCFTSSFLGNLFLMPLDEKFEEFQDCRDVRYFRYMDDVRIFAKHEEDARLAIFTMDRELRRLHLNVQTAKTKIYDENDSEISKALVDDRVDEISKLIEQVHQKHGESPIPKSLRTQYLSHLDRIAKRQRNDQQPILGSRRPLEGLTSRAFARWITAHTLLDSDKFIGRLVYEIQRNADYKLSKKLVSATRNFPRKRSLESTLLTFIASDANIFPHQEAECLHALRYLSRLSKETIEHAKSRLKNHQADIYLRVQAAYLLSRTELNPNYIRSVESAFNKEENPYIQVAMAGLLVQRRKDHSAVVRSLVFHPNDKIRELGRLFRSIKNDVGIAKAHLQHILREEVPWIICDSMPFIHLMANSGNDEIRRLLLDAIRGPRKTHPVCDIRDVLQGVFIRVKASLQ